MKLSLVHRALSVAAAVVVVATVVVAAVAAAATESIALMVGISLKADSLATVP